MSLSARRIVFSAGASRRGRPLGANHSSPSAGRPPGPCSDKGQKGPQYAEMSGRQSTSDFRAGPRPPPRILRSRPSPDGPRRCLHHPFKIGRGDSLVRISVKFPMQNRKVAIESAAIVTVEGFAIRGAFGEGPFRGPRTEGDSPFPPGEPPELSYASCGRLRRSVADGARDWTGPSGFEQPLTRVRTGAMILAQRGAETSVQIFSRFPR